VGNLLGKLSYSVEIMTSPSNPGVAARSEWPTSLFASLDHEWLIMARCVALQARCHAWAAAEPALQDCADARALISLVTWDGFQPSGRGRRVLSALLRFAADPWAARALLQAVLPRLEAEEVLVPKYGHGVNENWQRPADTIADLVAESYTAIMRHAGEDRDDVARVVLQEATRRLRTARQRQRRYQTRTVLLAPGHLDGAPADLSVARSEAEWLATALMEAVRCGRLTTREASLVYGTRVKGLPASEAGCSLGMRPKAVYYALARAERALVRDAA
jgi:DNA-directed RNA polymerase specialized sigma24 family protein